MFDYFKTLAKKHKIAIVGSTPVGTPNEALKLPPVPNAPLDSDEWRKWLANYTVDENLPPTIYNQAFFIDDKGEMVGVYRKRNLWHPERYVCISPS